MSPAPATRRDVGARIRRRRDRGEPEATHPRSSLASLASPPPPPGRERLEVAVEATGDAVVITDPAGTIIYVNAAFERVSGWPRAEAIGQNPRILSASFHSPAFYAAMWSTLTAGRTWHGELVNRARDGRLYVEEATITPVFAADGSLTQYVGVKRDVTAARALQTRLDEPAVPQATMSAMLADLRPGDSPESIADAICDRVVTVSGVALVALALFLPGGGLETLAAIGRERLEIKPVTPDGPWTTAQKRRARSLLERLRTGSTIERWSPGTASPMAATFDRLGITALATTPIVANGETIGFLQAGAAGADAEAVLGATQPMLDTFAVLASVLLAPKLDGRARTEERQAAVRRLIERREFRPVFQPIVDLRTGEIAGFEALTRFFDGTAPDAWFGAAAAAGLGIELELATLEAALAAAADLPRDAWLDLNVSPALLEDPTRLAYLIWKASARPLVLEITEHVVIDDYERLRQRIREIGIPVRLAVDDAGAGFASLRHILELRPDIVKLDRSLIVDVDRDPVRQGLVAGLRHFGSIARATVVAEGIESEEERAALVDLGIEFGQGYLLGRPLPAREAARRPYLPPPGLPTVERAAGHGGDDAPDLVHRVNAILWEADGTDERMTFVSGGAASVTGHPSSRWLTEPRFWENHIHPDDRPAMLNAIGAAMRAAAGVALEYRFRLSDGSYRWFEDLVEILPGDLGHTRLVGVMIDVTERRRLEEELANRATHDPLTGLLNREGIQQRLGATGANGPADGPASAIVFLDLDEFKIVNDSLGHRAGDDVLRLVASRLRDSVRDSDAVARFGGDEFLVHASAPDPTALVDLARRLIEVVAEPSEVGGRLMAHPVSAGIAFLAPGQSPDEAIRNADLAMYVAKRAGGGRLELFDPAMLQAAVDRLARTPAA